jgi:hypothetical protein
MIGFGEGERFLDAQSGAPEDHDQAREPAAVRAVTGCAHEPLRLTSARDVRAGLARSLGLDTCIDASPRRDR